MHGPGNEASIKKLLVSDKREERVSGLEQLDTEFRVLISGRIRHWSDTNGYRLTADNICDVWRETIKSVTQNVEKDRFKFDGRLNAYLGKIARRRAIDLLRKRIKWENLVELPNLPPLPAPVPDSVSDLKTLE